MTQSVNQSISDGGDCRTAPATPGLLKNNNVVVGRHNLDINVDYDKVESLQPPFQNSILFY